MSVIDDVIDTLDIRPHGDIVGGMIKRARTELAQLRAAAAELKAAHVYLDESPVNSHDDTPLVLADRVAGIVNELIECRSSRQEAREIITAYLGLSLGVMHITMSDQNEIARAWLAAYPVPSESVSATKEHNV